MPVTAGDQQRATLLARASDHCPRPRRRHRTPAKAEHDQIHAIHQHGRHLNGIRSRFGDDSEPTQIRSHFNCRKQTTSG